MLGLLTETASRLRSSLENSRVDHETVELLEMAVWLSDIYAAPAPETRGSLTAAGIPEAVLNLVDALNSGELSDPSVRLIYTLAIQSVLSSYDSEHPAYIKAAEDLRRLNFTKD